MSSRGGAPRASARAPKHTHGFKRTKHILRHAYELRDRVLRRIFVPTYVETAAQLADVLTKGLRPASHLRFLAALLPDCAR